MAVKSPKVQLQFISQNLAEAQNKINDAKALLKELELSLASILPSSRDLPGITGKFDGTYLVTDDGKKIQVPENYAGKSKLVYGDTLKMIDEADGSHTFKQIERVSRTTLTGILVKKDGKFVAVTSDGSHALLPAAVSFQHGVENDEVKVIVPEDARNCCFAALDEIPNKKTVTNPVETPYMASNLKEKIDVKIEIPQVEKKAQKPAVKPPVARPVIAKPAPVKVAAPATVTPPVLATPSVSSILADDDLR
jgi:hypothetical protein